MSEYLEKGSYGCIIKPNLNCNGTFGNINEITKFFFNKESYLIEKKNHERMEKIDKKNSFIVKKISNCKIVKETKFYFVSDKGFSSIKLN